MKVVAFNASPNREVGTTAIILNPLLKGMESEGAEIILRNTYDMRIEACLGCTNRLDFTSDHHCIINDDLKEIYPTMREAELWIFASPNYLNSDASGLKNLFDRLEPLFAMPDISNGNFSNMEQALQDKGKSGKVLLVSTCGHWGTENFYAIVEQVRAVADMLNREFLPPILRPHSGVLATLTGMGKPADDIYQAAEEAGAELVRNGSISKETMSKISREIVSKDSFLQELSQIVK